MIIVRWLMHDAAWWQFWYPQSSAPGGLIAAVATASTALAVHWLLT